MSTPFTITPRSIKEEKAFEIQKARIFGDAQRGDEALEGSFMFLARTGSLMPYLTPYPVAGGGRLYAYRSQGPYTPVVMAFTVEVAKGEETICFQDICPAQPPDDE